MKDSHPAASADAVCKEYSARQLALEEVAASSNRRSARALVTCAACIALFFLSFVMKPRAYGSYVSELLVASLAAIWQIRLFSHERRRAIDAAHRAAFYQRGTDRITGNWPEGGRDGSEFARGHHLYQTDLDIFGRGSLFELLATTRSDAGAERLAAYLLDPATPAEARARQDAVKELRPAVTLREEIDVLGKYRFQDCSQRRLRAWLDLPVLRVPKAVAVALFLLSLISLGLAVAGCTQFYAWAAVAPMLVLSLACQGACSLAFMRQVRERINVMQPLGSDVSLLRAGIELVARAEFRSAKLSEIALSLQNADKAVRTLERHLAAVERRENPVLYGILVWFAVGTQLVLAIERWRPRNQERFEAWLSAWAEFEALSALAGFAYEHPAHAFPDLVDGSGCFEAQDMGHPLLSDRVCVSNDISLNNTTRFNIVSGSNMAGKSTLLRAIGLNAVLAAAGAPVCARQARIAVMNVCASIGIGDSLQNGASKFFAEIERLRESVAIARKGEPVLFLIDEMLAGTNSRDRSIAAEWLLEALIASGAIGALSTHDLALTEIAKREALRGINVHMQSRSEENPLDFDYRLRPGIATQTNGLAIVRMMTPEL